eukprot:jgi/Botrbrau1/15282/Bobra.97_1s0008.1
MRSGVYLSALPPSVRSSSGQTAGFWTGRLWIPKFWTHLGRTRAEDQMGQTDPLLSVAPMMDWTDVHYRQLARLMTRRTWLYTEMYVDQTLLHSTNLDRFLWYPQSSIPSCASWEGATPINWQLQQESLKAMGTASQDLALGALVQPK